MLRPATPLTVIFLVSFVFSLLPVISAPLVRSIALCNYQGIEYGVFGYCVGDTCSPFSVGYNPVDPKHPDFSVSAPATRHTLTEILIVHPVACLFQLISLILALVAHFHSPSHSSRYLLVLIVFMLPTLLVTLLAFLVDILLFIPSLNWPGWLVLAAVILDVIAGIMLCAMRRTLVSRKARTRRIAENADMNGTMMYDRQVAQAQPRADSPPPFDQPSLPDMNGGVGGDKLPQFATYEASRERKVSDDRVPLNDRADTATSASSFGGRRSHETAESYAFGGPRRGGSLNGGRGGRAQGPLRDEFGNPLPPSTALGYNPDRPGSRTGSLTGSLGSRGRGGPYRGGGYGRSSPMGSYGSPGRGGPPPQGRGGMGPGFSAGAAAGALAGDMGGGRGPPPGYSSDSYQMQDRPPMNGAYGQMRQGPGPQPAPGYGPNRQSPAPGYGRGPPPGHYGNGPQSPRGLAYQDGQLARAESPPPLSSGPHQPYGRAETPPSLAVAGAGVAGQAEHHQHEERFYDAPEMESPNEHAIGQAVEMDARTGSPAHSPNMAQAGYSQFHRTDSPLRQGSAGPASAGPYNAPPSSDVYVPARAAWQSNVTATSTPPQQTNPTELPARSATTSKPAGAYYEDVDPMFSQDYPRNQSDASHIGVALDGPPGQGHAQGNTGSHRGYGGGGYAY